MQSRSFDYQLDKKDIVHVEGIIKSFFNIDDFTRLTNVITVLNGIAKNLLKTLSRNPDSIDDLESVKNYLDKLFVLVQRIKSIAKFYDLLMDFAKEYNETKIASLIDHDKYGTLKNEMKALNDRMKFLKPLAEKIELARIRKLRAERVAKKKKDAEGLKSESSEPEQQDKADKKDLVPLQLEPLTPLDEDFKKLKKLVYEHIEKLLSKHIVIHASHKIKNASLMGVDLPDTLKELEEMKEQYEEWYTNNPKFVRYAASLFSLSKDISEWLISLSLVDKAYLSIFPSTFRKDYQKLKEVLPSDTDCDKNIDLANTLVNREYFLKRMSAHADEIAKRNTQSIAAAIELIQISDNLILSIQSWLDKTNIPTEVEDKKSLATKIYSEGSSLPKTFSEYNSLKLDELIRKLELAKIDASKNELQEIEPILLKLIQLKTNKDIEKNISAFYAARKELRMTYHITPNTSRTLSRGFSFAKLDTSKLTQPSSREAKEAPEKSKAPTSARDFLGIMSERRQPSADKDTIISKEPKTPNKFPKI